MENFKRKCQTKAATLLFANMLYVERRLQKDIALHLLDYIKLLTCVQL